MTINNDVCDFHGGYCDPIGCDTKSVLLPDGTMWCGQCEPGRIFKFRLLDNNQLRQAREAAIAENEASGLGYEYDQRGGDYKAWWVFLHRDSLIYNAARELERRAEDTYSYPDKKES